MTTPRRKTATSPSRPLRSSMPSRSSPRKRKTQEEESPSSNEAKDEEHVDSDDNSDDDNGAGGATSTPRQSRHLRSLPRTRRSQDDKPTKEKESKDQEAGASQGMGYSDGSDNGGEDGASGPEDNDTPTKNTSGKGSKSKDDYTKKITLKGDLYSSNHETKEEKETDGRDSDAAGDTATKDYGNSDSDDEAKTADDNKDESGDDNDEIKNDSDGEISSPKSKSKDNTKTKTDNNNTNETNDSNDSDDGSEEESTNEPKTPKTRPNKSTSSQPSTTTPSPAHKYSLRQRTPKSTPSSMDSKTVLKNTPAPTYSLHATISSQRGSKSLLTKTSPGGEMSMKEKIRAIMATNYDDESDNSVGSEGSDEEGNPRKKAKESNENDEKEDDDSNYDEGTQTTPIIVKLPLSTPSKESIQKMQKMVPLYEYGSGSTLSMKMDTGSQGMSPDLTNLPKLSNVPIYSKLNPVPMSFDAPGESKNSDGAGDVSDEAFKKGDKEYMDESDAENATHANNANKADGADDDHAEDSPVSPAPPKQPKRKRPRPSKDSPNKNPVPKSLPFLKDKEIAKIIFEQEWKARNRLNLAYKQEQELKRARQEREGAGAPGAGGDVNTINMGGDDENAIDKSEITSPTKHENADSTAPSTPSTPSTPSNLSKNGQYNTQSWTPTETINFFRGVYTHSWGEWKLISSRMIKTRSNSQVKTHAQKLEKRYPQLKPFFSEDNVKSMHVEFGHVGTGGFGGDGLRRFRGDRQFEEKRSVIKKKSEKKSQGDDTGGESEMKSSKKSRLNDGKAIKAYHAKKLKAAGDELNSMRSKQARSQARNENGQFLKDTIRSKQARSQARNEHGQFLKETIRSKQARSQARNENGQFLKVPKVPKGKVKKNKLKEKYQKSKSPKARSPKIFSPSLPIDDSELLAASVMNSLKQQVVSPFSPFPSSSHLQSEHGDVHGDIHRDIMRQSNIKKRPIVTICLGDHVVCEKIADLSSMDVVANIEDADGVNEKRTMDHLLQESIQADQVASSLCEPPSAPLPTTHQIFLPGTRIYARWLNRDDIMSFGRWYPGFITGCRLSDSHAISESEDDDDGDNDGEHNNHDGHEKHDEPVPYLLYDVKFDDDSECIGLRGEDLMMSNIYEKWLMDLEDFYSPRDLSPLDNVANGSTNGRGGVLSGASRRNRNAHIGGPRIMKGRPIYAQWFDESDPLLHGKWLLGTVESSKAVRGEEDSTGVFEGGVPPLKRVYHITFESGDKDEELDESFVLETHVYERLRGEKMKKLQGMEQERMQKIEQEVMHQMEQKSVENVTSSGIGGIGTAGVISSPERKKIRVTGGMTIVGGVTGSSSNNGVTSGIGSGASGAGGAIGTTSGMGRMSGISGLDLISVATTMTSPLKGGGQPGGGLSGTGRPFPTWNGSEGQSARRQLIPPTAPGQAIQASHTLSGIDAIATAAALAPEEISSHHRPSNLPSNSSDGPTEYRRPNGLNNVPVMGESDIASTNSRPSHSNFNASSSNASNDSNNSPIHSPNSPNYASTSTVETEEESADGAGGAGNLGGADSEDNLGGSNSADGAITESELRCNENWENASARSETPPTFPSRSLDTPSPKNHYGCYWLMKGRPMSLGQPRQITPVVGVNEGENKERSENGENRENVGNIEAVASVGNGEIVVKNENVEKEAKEGNKDKGVGENVKKMKRGARHREVKRRKLKKDKCDVTWAGKKELEKKDRKDKRGKVKKEVKREVVGDQAVIGVKDEVTQGGNKAKQEEKLKKEENAVDGRVKVAFPVPKLAAPQVPPVLLPPTAQVTQVIHLAAPQASLQDSTKSAPKSAHGAVPRVAPRAAPLAVPVLDTTKRSNSANSAKSVLAKESKPTNEPVVSTVGYYGTAANVPKNNKSSNSAASAISPTNVPTNAAAASANAAVKSAFSASKTTKTTNSFSGASPSTFATAKATVEPSGATAPAATKTRNTFGVSAASSTKAANAEVKAIDNVAGATTKISASSSVTSANVTAGMKATAATSPKKTKPTDANASPTSTTNPSVKAMTNASTMGKSTAAAAAAANTSVKAIAPTTTTAMKTTPGANASTTTLNAAIKTTAATNKAAPKATTASGKVTVATTSAVAKSTKSGTSVSSSASTASYTSAKVTAPTSPAAAKITTFGASGSSIATNAANTAAKANDASSLALTNTIKPVTKISSNATTLSSTAKGTGATTPTAAKTTKLSGSAHTGTASSAIPPAKTKASISASEEGSCRDDNDKKVTTSPSLPRTVVKLNTNDDGISSKAKNNAKEHKQSEPSGDKCT